MGFVHLRVTDLEEARNHYSDTLGMTVVAEQPGKLQVRGKRIGEQLAAALSQEREYAARRH